MTGPAPNPADEKAVRNERTKLTCTALNNIAVAFVVTGVVVPLISRLTQGVADDGLFRFLAAMWCFAAGALLHASALLLMRKIKG